MVNKLVISQETMSLFTEALDSIIGDYISDFMSNKIEHEGEEIVFYFKGDIEYKLDVIMSHWLKSLLENKFKPIISGFKNDFQIESSDSSDKNYEFGREDLDNLFNKISSEIDELQSFRIKLQKLKESYLVKRKQSIDNLIKQFFQRELSLIELIHENG